MNGIPELANAKIVIVDDDPDVLNFTTRLLQRRGFVNVHATRRANSVAAMCEKIDPDIVLLDWHMPDVTGLEVLQGMMRRLPELGYLPVLVMTADTSPEVRHTALTAGASDFVTKPLDVVEVLARIENLLHTRLLHSQVIQEKEELAQVVDQRTRELYDARIEALDRLAAAAELRDDATGKHTRRVGELAASIADSLGLPGDMVELIKHAAPLHDVGKIAIPDAILLKPSALTDTEQAMMRRHTTLGAEILGGSASPLLQLAEEIALNHHERWNGEGYPHQKAGTNIPVAARIVAVADCFDALTHDRVYRPALSRESAVSYVSAQSGSMFDPEVVHAFLSSS